jgi:hypothetical protein
MLEELQSLSQANKKKILIVSTIIIMIIVIGVWVSYFNSIVIGNAPAPAAQATSTATASETVLAPIVITPATSTSVRASSPGIWQDIKNWFGSIANIFQKPSQYNIQPQSN